MATVPAKKKAQYLKRFQEVAPDWVSAKRKVDILLAKAEEVPGANKRIGISVIKQPRSKFYAVSVQVHTEVQYGGE